MVGVARACELARHALGGTRPAAAPHSQPAPRAAYLAALALLAQHHLVAVPHALALVRLRLALAADVGGKLAHQLLVEARDLWVWGRGVWDVGWGWWSGGTRMRA